MYSDPCKEEGSIWVGACMLNRRRLSWPKPRELTDEDVISHEALVLLFKRLWPDDEAVRRHYAELNYKGD